MMELSGNKGKEQSGLLDTLQLLGFDPDPEQLESFLEFWQDAKSEENPKQFLYNAWKDLGITDPTWRQCLVTILTAPDGYEIPGLVGSSGMLISALIAQGKYGIYGENENTPSLRERLRNRPDLVNELARGVLSWQTLRAESNDPSSSAPEYKIHRAYEEYQTVIQELLPLVDPEIADKLFECYNELNRSDAKTEPSEKVTSGHGYHKRLGNLLRDPEVPDKYKLDIMENQWLAFVELEQPLGNGGSETERMLQETVDFIRQWVKEDNSLDDPAKIRIITDMVDMLEERVNTQTFNNLLEQLRSLGPASAPNAE
ncbi:hypothetical protein FWH58_03635 [Candidatus Saccharibacteria bacterium]|nr:hypothetical protein [Candidatus Saccharibacteria bacterium]